MPSLFFIALTFFAAFSIETLGTIISVIGLSTLFGGSLIIIAMAVAFDIGKVVTVSLAYTYWSSLNWLMKSYALIALVVTMVITSAGAAGYLSGEFQKAIMGTQEGTTKISLLKEEQAKLEARKKQIDDQIANLPANFSRSRVTLMREFEAEQKRIDSRLVAINEELPTLQVAQIGSEAKAGPIIYISKAFDVPIEKAVGWVVLMIIFVFDPLAVFLIVAGNFLWAKRKLMEEQKVASVMTTIDARDEDVEDITTMPLHMATTPREEEPQVTHVPAEILQEVKQALDVPTEATTTPTVADVPQEAPVPPKQPKREQIRLKDITPKAVVVPHKSSLSDVREDPSVVFDPSPTVSKASDMYRNQK